MTDTIASRDRMLLQVIDTSMAEAVARSDGHLQCKAGCCSCCVGPLPITPLDAWRLRQGLAKLPPEQAETVRARARKTFDIVGELPVDETGEASFSQKSADVPCPALNPVSGACDLYEDRPVTCRTFGPPVLIGGDPLPPCKICFTSASPASIEAARVEIDPDGMESWALDLFDAPHTSVAAALAKE